MLIHDFATTLENADTLEKLEAALQAYLNPFGFTHYAFTYYSGHVKSGRKLRYDYVSKALQLWHQYYLQEYYADVDRTLEESHLITLPLLWDVKEQLTQAKNKRETRIRTESINFGIYKGLSLPVHGPHNDFATLTLHQCQRQTCLTDYKIKQYEWLSASQIYYHYVKKIIELGKNVSPFQLTKREDQCLTLTAKSWRVEQIAKELKISERTVNFHLQNANKKLGANNKYQATYKYFQLINHKE